MSAPDRPGFRLGLLSRDRLSGVHPDLAAVVRLAITLTRVDFRVQEGLRSAARQAQLKAQGASRTLASRHLAGPDGYGRAVDLVPLVAGKVRWDWPLFYPIAEAMRAAARERDVPLRWGGTWSLLADIEGDPETAVADYVAQRRRAGLRAFIDGPHFELPRGERYP